MSEIEYSNGRLRNPMEAFRGLAKKAGLPLAHVMELASENRLTDLFDVETRSLAYRDGKRIPQVELRAMARQRDPRVLLAEMKAKDPSTDGRAALRRLQAKRQRWTTA